MLLGMKSRIVAATVSILHAGIGCTTSSQLCGPCVRNASVVLRGFNETFGNRLPVDIDVCVGTRCDRLRVWQATCQDLGVTSSVRLNCEWGSGFQFTIVGSVRSDDRDAFSPPQVAIEVEVAGQVAFSGKADIHWGDELSSSNDPCVRECAGGSAVIDVSKSSASHL